MVEQPVEEKENTELKSAVLCFKIDLVSYPAHEGALWVTLTAFQPLCDYSMPKGLEIAVIVFRCSFLRDFCRQFYDINYSYLIQKTCTPLNGFKYFYLILIVYTQLYCFKNNILWFQVLSYGFFNN